MKNILLLLLLFCTGCYQYDVFMSLMKEEQVYSYKPSQRLVKRVLYYNKPEDILNQFGGNFNELIYLGRIIDVQPSEYYISVVTVDKDKVDRMYINYNDSIIYIDGANSGIEDKHLFLYNTEYFKHYLILRKRSKPKLDWIYWEIDKLEKGY